MHRYRVELKNGNVQDVLYTPYDSERQIYDDELTENLGSTATFDFSVPPAHPLLPQIEPLASKVIVYDGDTVIYYGRVANDGKDILGTGSVQTVGAMSYLADSVQEPFSFSGTLQAYITQLLNKHNAQCDTTFQVGSIMSGSVTVVSNEYKDTLTVLKETTQETLGGYLRIRYISAGTYAVDYQLSYGTNSQVVRLGENIADLSSERSPEDIVTRLIPLGIEVTPNDQSKLPRYVVIDGVNNGVGYVQNDELFQKYGAIYGVRQWDTITDPNVLKSTAQAYVNSLALPESFEIEAVDLSYIDDGVAAFSVGYNTHIVSSAHGIDTEYLLTSKTTHLTNPANDTITLGDTKASLSQQVVNNKNEAQKENNDTKTDLGNTIVQTGMTITGAKGGYVIMDTYDEDGNAVAPWQILIMDQPDKQSAKNVIRMNQNGIGFSTNGYNGPYTNAWTIDGNLNATFIRSGTLIMGGSTWNTDGVIRILNTKDETLMEMSKDGITINSGKMNAPEISGGKMNAPEISGGKITGAQIDIGDGFFYADDQEVGIGGFYSRSSWGRNIFQSNDGQCGMSAEPTSDGGLWFWAGYSDSGDFDFAVNNGGQCWARDFMIVGEGSISDRLRRIENDIEDLQNGGGE